MFPLRCGLGLVEVVIALLFVSFAAPGFAYAQVMPPPPPPSGPTLTSVAIASNNSTSTLATVGNTVTITFTSSEAIDTPSATILGQAASITDLSGDTYTASYTLLASDAEGIVTFTIDFNASGGGTAGAQVTDVTDSSSVTFDRTAPVIESHAAVGAEATSSSGAIISYTSPTADDGSTVTCLPASGTTFALGTTTVTCNASDAAGNAATPTTFSVGVVDTTAPVITLTGAPSLTLTVADSFTDEGATTADIVDGAGTADVSGSVNTSSAGTYTLTYDKTDAAGNHAAAVTRTVTVNAPPAPPAPPSSGGGGGSGGSLFPVAPVFGDAPPAPPSPPAPAPSSSQGTVLGAQTTNVPESSAVDQTAPAETPAPSTQSLPPQGNAGGVVAQARTVQAPVAETPPVVAPEVEPQRNADAQLAASGPPGFSWWWLLLLLALGAAYWAWRKYKEYKKRHESEL